MKGNFRLVAMALALTLVGTNSALPLAAQERTGVRPPPPRAIELPCCRCLDGKKTSVNVSTGTAPWSVAFGNSGAAPAGLVSNVAWTPVPPGKWIGPGSDKEGDYTYQMPFQVPKCLIPMQVTISGKFAADNSAKLSIGGNVVASSQGTPNYGFLPGSVTPFTWSGTLAPGPQSITVVVTNSGGPTGLVVAATITVTCPNMNSGPIPS